MEKYPRISIITPSYNQGQYIEQTICSVLDQNYPNLEYIIIDGGSIDNTVDIIKKYEKHLKYWVSEKDRGQSHAINKGLEHCTGEIFNWINSDDYFAANAFSKVAEAFANPQIDMYSGKIQFVDERTSGIRYWGPVRPFKTMPMTAGYSIVAQQSTFFRLKNIRAIGGVNESLHLVMDREMYIKHYLRFGNPTIVQDEDVVAYFRLYDETKTVSQSRKFHDETLTFFKCLADEYGLAEYSSAIASLIINPCTYYKPDFSTLPKHSTKVITQLLSYGLLREADMYSWGKQDENARRAYKSIRAFSLQPSDALRVLKKQFIDKP